MSQQRSIFFPGSTLRLKKEQLATRKIAGVSAEIDFLPAKRPRRCPRITCSSPRRMPRSSGLAGPGPGARGLFFWRRGLDSFMRAGKRGEGAQNSPE